MQYILYETKVHWFLLQLYIYDFAHVSSAVYFCVIYIFFRLLITCAAYVCIMCLVLLTLARIERQENGRREGTGTFFL